MYGFVPNNLPDYEIIPDHEDELQWNVRIKDGEFIETVYRYGSVRYDETDAQIKYDFTIISSPNPDATNDNLEFQNVAAEILIEVFINGHT